MPFYVGINRGLTTKDKQIIAISYTNINQIQRTFTLKTNVENTISTYIRSIAYNGGYLYAVCNNNKLWKFNASDENETPTVINFGANGIDLPALTVNAIDVDESYIYLAYSKVSFTVPSTQTLISNVYVLQLDKTTLQYVSHVSNQYISYVTRIRISSDSNQNKFLFGYCTQTDNNETLFRLPFINGKIDSGFSSGGTHLNDFIANKKGLFAVSNSSMSRWTSSLVQTQTGLISGINDIIWTTSDDAGEFIYVGTSNGVDSKIYRASIDAVLADPLTAIWQNTGIKFSGLPFVDGNAGDGIFSGGDIGTLGIVSGVYDDVVESNLSPLPYNTPENKTNPVGTYGILDTFSETDIHDVATHNNPHLQLLKNDLALYDMILGSAPSLSSSLTTNGYYKFSNGLIIQWGKAGPFTLSASGNFNINFNTNFTTCFNILLTTETLVQVDGTISLYVKTGTITNSGFVALSDNNLAISTSGFIYWFAIGV